MKIKIWVQIVDAGDGSSYVNIYPTREAAYEGYDEEGFDLKNKFYPPVEIYDKILDVTDFEKISD